MKKVRFETPTRGFTTRMDDSECHSPRPFLERQTSSHVPSLPEVFDYQRIIPYNDDPVQRFEYGDSSPYPTVRKTYVPNAAQRGSKYIPSNDLDLSMLDSSNHEPRKLIHRMHAPLKSYNQPEFNISTPSYAPTTRSPDNFVLGHLKTQSNTNRLSSKENTPPNVLKKDNSFFLRRDNLDKYCVDKELQLPLNRLGLDGKNAPTVKTIDNFRPLPSDLKTNLQENIDQQLNTIEDSPCRCHHCVKAAQIVTPHTTLPVQKLPNHCQQKPQTCHHCPCMPIPPTCFHCEQHNMHTSPKCQALQSNSTPAPQNAVDKKNWAIERLEQSKKDCKDLEKQSNVVKEKREPTVADLFKIIKLQNEQLQLLQDKVDKFISTSQKTQNVQPIENYMTEHVALQTIDAGVMTSFEMVRTSTVINKEVVKQSCENAQIQCNRSQISIKEVISKSQPVNLNFLDGIMPVTRAVQSDESNRSGNENPSNLNEQENYQEEKTFNELSLYNVQVDNATTPLISPEQSLYLDVRDYSDSDSSSDNQSNVGWTYYNKVMNRVNGLLQDSDMPSSASALHRNTRQQCMQMQIDKTNVSVTKRVKFGDDPLGIHQPHIYAATTDTSLKMNQLAAKYLKSAAPQRVTKASTTPIDMSFATRNYMEKHRIIQGLPSDSRSPPVGEMPRFLDITALKQQPKFL